MIGEYYDSHPDLTPPQDLPFPHLHFLLQWSNCQLHTVLRRKTTMPSFPYGYTFCVSLDQLSRSFHGLSHLAYALSLMPIHSLPITYGLWKSEVPAVYPGELTISPALILPHTLLANKDFLTFISLSMHLKWLFKFIIFSFLTIFFSWIMYQFVY